MSITKDNSQKRLWVLLLSGLCHLLLISPISVQAFDCLKAHTNQENLICKSKTLQTADARLNDLYQAVLASSNVKMSHKQQQKDWLINVRNKCTDSECLDNAYSARIDQLLATLHRCHVDQDKIEGYWTRIGDGGYFEEISIDPDGAFSSWLHHRPESSGTWKIDGCLLDIGDAPTDIEWIVVSLSSRRLTVYEIGAGLVFYRISE